MIYRVGGSIAAIAMLAACGGSGSRTPPTSSPNPIPLPSPTPTPIPTPSPTPSSTFDTAEFRESDGPAQHRAISAWEDGATGENQTIAIIDTGIDRDSPEFAGRIHPSSADVAGNRGIEAEDDHGTNVALVAAGGRNNSGILGIAFDADLLVLRADSPGTCGTDTPEDTTLGCSFFDSDIAAGIDRAINAGAKVVNISLGGGNASGSVRAAVARAAAAGVVVVVAAGNGGDGSTAGVDPNQPNQFASDIRAAGNGNVIIVGSVDAGDVISSFSQRAGNEAQSYLTARGERICCVYEDGQIFVGQDAQGQFRLLFSGTSFATPQVAGAVALMAQAFPNLSGQQIVEILLDTARDAGASGTDATYGRGVLDIASAFAPQGTTTLGNGTSTLRIGSSSAIGSAAMGDAFAATNPVQGVLLDSYQRAYSYDLSVGMRGASVQPKLHGALDAQRRHVSVGSKDVSLGFSIADPGSRPQNDWVQQLRLTPEQAHGAQVLAARMAARIAPGTQVGFALSETSHGLVAQMQGAERPAFLIAGEAGRENGFFQSSDFGFAMRQQFGSTGLTFGAESGEVWLGNWRVAEDILPGRRERRPVRSFSIAADRSFGPLEAVFGLSWMQEDETVLGGFFHESFGLSGADTLFLDTATAIELSPGWRLGAAWRQGFTRPARSGLVADGSSFASNAWSLDLTRYGAFTSGDSFGLRLAQPLRVSTGGLNLNLPVSYDYASESFAFGTQSAFHSRRRGVRLSAS